MGQYLSAPSTEKLCESGSNGRFLYGLAAMQGWRLRMEDAHAAVLDLDGPGESSNAFFGVYDGHGGSSAAQFAGENVHKRLVKEESYQERNWEMALKRAFLGTDEDLLADGLKDKEPSGCTAVAALVTDDKIYVANAGDSRSVLSVQGKVKPLSFDHKPTNRTEIERIKAAGGFWENGRVNGLLAMSRALGDFQLKQNRDLSPEAQILTANPDITCHETTEEDEFLILACDGIWDCLSSQQVVDFVRYQIFVGKELTKICEMILEHCLAPDTESGDKGCDNMTLLVVGITHGRTKKAWYKWMKERVKNKQDYAPPALYSAWRLKKSQERKAAQAAHQKTLGTPAANKTTQAKPKAVVVEKRSLVGWVVAYFTKLVEALSGIVAKWKR